MHKLRLSIVVTAAFVGACGRYQVKPPKPIEPQVRLSAFKTRTLDDASLAAYLNASLRSSVSLPKTRWELPALTLAAFYYHPEIELSRARAAVAEAAVVTASQRNNPNFGFGTTLETPFQEILPWILAPSLDLLFQRGSQRQFRTAAAKHLADAARWDLGATAWQVRSRLRRRFTDHVFSVKELELSRDEEAIRAEYLSLLETKIEFRDISRLEVESARIELQRVRLQVKAAEGRVAETRAAMPEALGVPASAVEGVEFYEPRLDNPLELTDGLLQTLESDALLNRIDIRRVLDEYAAAEAALHMELAGQRPDFSLGPAFRWREGQQRWTLGVSFDLPVFNRNEGPIAEAEARRESISKQFDQLQTSVVAQVEQAFASYRAVIDERRSVTELSGAAEQRLLAVQQLFELRDVDYTSVVAARLELALAKTAGWVTRRKMHTALGMIEDAIQKPVGEEFVIPEAELRLQTRP